MSYKLVQTLLSCTLFKCAQVLLLVRAMVQGPAQQEVLGAMHQHQQQASWQTVTYREGIMYAGTHTKHSHAHTTTRMLKCAFTLARTHLICTDVIVIALSFLTSVYRSLAVYLHVRQTNPHTQTHTQARTQDRKSVV